MKKISNLLMMALLAIGMGLTSCDEQLDNAVTPVVAEVTSIEVDLSKIDEKYLDTEKTKLQLTVGDEVTLSFTILPEEMASTEVELTAADATILSIDGLKVKALKEGETTVTAKAGDKTAECTVTVKAAAKTLAEATAGDIGKIVGADGKIYATKADAEAVATGNAVAMIAYVGSETGVADYTHGLALALTDEAEKMKWSTATGASGAAAHTPAAPTSVTSSWMLPSKDQWDKMIDACKNVLGTKNTHEDLRDGFSVISGASNLQSGRYWSSTEYNAYNAWFYGFDNGSWNYTSMSFSSFQVRACLAF